MGSKTTSQVTNSPNPTATAAYNDVVGQAQSVASTPYQPYTGQLVAGLNAQQNRAVGQLANSYGAAQPYIDEGNADLQAGSSSLGNVGAYLQAGSDATAGATAYQGLGVGAFGQAGAYGDAASSALQGMQPYMGMTASGLGTAAGTYGAALGTAGDAMGYYGQEASGLGAAGNYLSSAAGMLGQAQGLGTPQQFSASAVQQYENPYTQSVIDSTMANLNENDAVQSQQQTAGDIGAGAYGGDRAAVGQAELARQQDLANNQTVAGLESQDYSQALEQFNTTNATNLQAAGLLNQGAGEMAGLGTSAVQQAEGYGNVAAGLTSNAGTLAGIASGETSNAGAYNTLAQDQGQMAQEYGTLGQVANQTGSGYTGLAADSLGQASSYGTLGQLQGTTGQAYGTLGTEAGNLGSVDQSNIISGASAALQGGTLRQENTQQQDTAAYNQYMAGLSYPYQNVGFLSNIVQGIGSQEGNTQTTQGNALSQIAGLGTSTIGLLGATGAFGSSGYLSGLGSSVGSLFSDERVKQDIAPIGKTFDGQTMYRFRYKGDPSGTVHTGLMAQEVEKRTPGAVGEVGGVKTVDYGEATQGAAALGLGSVPPGLRPARASGGAATLGTRPRFDDGGAAAPAQQAAAPGDYGGHDDIGPMPAPSAGASGAAPAAAPSSASAAGSGAGAQPGFVSSDPSFADLSTAPAGAPAGQSSGSGLPAATLAGIQLPAPAFGGSAALDPASPGPGSSGTSGLGVSSSDPSSFASPGLGTPLAAWLLGQGSDPASAGAGQASGFASRPRFDNGGSAGLGSSPIPSGGLTMTGIPGGGGTGLGAGGLNTGPMLGAGRSVQEQQVQTQRGLGSSSQGLGVVSGAPTGGLGAPAFSGSSSGSLGATPMQSPSSPGFSPGAASGQDGTGQNSLGTPPSTSNQNGWLALAAAGAGMMSGTSMSGLANLGQGISQGISTYTALQQRDVDNAYKQQTLKIDQQRADQTALQMQQTAEYQRQQLAIQSANAATAASTAASENATRDQARTIARYSTGFVPGYGYVTRDLTNPTASPVVTPFDPSSVAGQGAPATAGAVASPPATGAPPPTASAPPPQPTASAPPPPGGVAASGVPPVGGAVPSSTAGAAVPTSAGTAFSAPPAAAGSAPAIAGTFKPSPAAWQPTTTVPSGYVPPNQFTIYQNPGLLQGEQQNATKSIEEARTQATAGQQLQMRLDEMDRQYAQLPKTGLLAPGQAATARADLAKGVNTFATALGGQAPYDPNALAANENLVKDRFRLGADLAKQMGGREPGFIVEQAVKANPGADNTPLAYQRITAGLRASVQWQQDWSAFQDDYNAKFGHVNGAREAFDRLNPPQAYANRAVVSTVDPRDVAALQQNSSNPAASAAIDRKYGAGTSSLILGQGQ